MTAWPQDSSELRQTVITVARALVERELAVNASGNVSARVRSGARTGFVVTPSGVPYDTLTADDLVMIDAAGERVGARQPSSEWHLHRAIYAARPEFGAVVHTHSPHATALACHGLGIPAFHYMVAAAGGTDIRCADYATFGTQELGDNAVAALADRRACLLAHHGVVACATSLADALALAVEVENLARTYLAARVFGEPPVLAAEEMKRVIERFRSYGQSAD